MKQIMQARAKLGKIHRNRKANYLRLFYWKLG